MSVFLEYALFCFTLYYIAINSFYIFLLILAYFENLKIARKQTLIEDPFYFPDVFPPISIIAPAYNEELNIVASVKSFLMLEYPKFEVIIVNDGSKDKTLEKLLEAYKLEETHIHAGLYLSPTEVRATYRSKLHPNMIVIDKVNGGGKSDALNVGVQYAQFDHVCAVDSDSILDSRALGSVILPFVEDPERTVATGGTIRVANGCTIKHGRVEDVALPAALLPNMQIIEYTRSFLCGRTGWNAMNLTLIISGAFGVFSKKAVAAVNGYSKSLGEDMDLIVRIHKYYLENKQDYRVVFLPDPVCWTEAPEDVKILSRQRNRWHRGLADILFRNMGMFFNPRYKFIGFTAFPYYLVVELLSPVIEVASWICLAAAVAIGIANKDLIGYFLIASVAYSAIVSVIALVLEEIFYPKLKRIEDFFKLAFMSILESFGYRQLSIFWRLHGLWDFVRGRTSWGEMTRKGLS